MKAPDSTATSVLGSQKSSEKLSKQRVLSVRALRWGQHLITAVLLLVALLRAISSSDSNTWLASAAATLFALWYLFGFVVLRSKGSTKLPGYWLAFLLASWALGMAASPEFMWVAFSLWLLIGHQLALGLSVLWSAAVYVVTVVAPFLHQGESTVSGIVGPLVGGTFAWGISRGYLQLERDIAERNELVASLLRAHQEMADLQEELIRSQHEAGALAERTRVAREIHDTIAQQLSSIGLHAKAALDSQQAPQAFIALERIESLSGQGLTDLRRIIAAMSPSELDTQALAGALRRMLIDFEKDCSVSSELRVDAELPVLDPGIQVALLRTAQSALANVRRHAKASKTVVSLADTGDAIRLDIVDDGIGFNLTNWQSALGKNLESGGFGLPAMRQRLRELGGGLDIESTLGEGTALSAYVPLKNPEAGN
ncbi:sensor histidine kinase [Glutamicibacter arilaitensis]|uniref:sensor histidine kinase n=1 Tax=Glutamicibacter arilaitensis TaxID=256701 RepID=UPI0038506FD2